MNTRCSICHHPQRAEIEQARISGVPFREIGRRFDRSKTTIQKHWKRCVPAAAQKALDAATAREVDAGQSIIARLRELSDRTEQQLATAEREKDGRLAVAAIREFRENLKLEAQLLGELGDGGINITNVELDPETLGRMAQMFLARKAAKAPKADLPGAIAAPSTVTLDVTVGYQPTAVEPEPTSNGGSA